MGEPAGLAEGQLRTLDRLSRVPELGGFYLGGGSAVSHHLHHRRSLDLDLFGAAVADLEPVRAAMVSALGDVRVVAAGPAVLRLVVEATPVDVVRYAYPPLEPPAPGPGGFPVAGLRDLAAMKLAAVARRGTRRDFWDLFAMVSSGLGLGTAASAYASRYGLSEPDLYHVARALTWFADAEADPVLPAGLTPEVWQRIRAFFEAEAPRLLLP
ncbi:MAG: nucleotidyl transferase AbiEii/AbiGii toxin family protein [Deltaproteobacteria bacterium]|nr:nucleotidyl transferase AbiEii/AbiGii toxin family protein [Deltaproteobacteria bacterium]